MIRTKTNVVWGSWKRENARLKKMYAELSVNHEILSEGYEMLKKWQAQDDEKK